MPIHSAAGRAKQAALASYTLRRASSALRRAAMLARAGKPARPLCLVYGNCQADPVRGLLANSAEFAASYEAVRIPAVHEISASQIPRLHRLFRGASLIVAQRVKDDYRGLPLGTDQVVALAPRGCSVIRFPALYYDALYPLQVYVHVDDRLSVPAPRTDYHDLRTLCAAAKDLTVEAAVRWVGQYRPPEAALHATAAQAAAMIRHYEGMSDVRVLDRIIAPPRAHARSFFTVSHPARFVLQAIADSVHEILGFARASDVHGAREPLGLFRTPLEQPVIDALELASEPAPDWIIKGKRVSTADVVRLHLHWYRQHPNIVEAGLREHAGRVTAFDLLR